MVFASELKTRQFLSQGSKYELQSGLEKRVISNMLWYECMCDVCVFCGCGVSGEGVCVYSIGLV